MQFPSPLVEAAVEQVSRLPGIGKRTALRLVLHLLKSDPELTDSLTRALSDLRHKVRFCDTCHSISDGETCTICASHRRDPATICVVEDTREVLAFENTGQYTGRYHVLGGLIQPMDGIGPDQLKIDTLVARAQQPEVTEIILALSPTMEGDTTAYYLQKRLADCSVRISTISRGVPVGGHLEYADEISLGRSILSRTQMNGS